MNNTLAIDWDKLRSYHHGGLFNQHLEKRSPSDTVVKDKIEYIKFGNVIVPLRRDSDFPNTTQQHSALESLINTSNRKTEDCPGITSMHLGLQSLTRQIPKIGETHNIVDIGCGLGAIGASLASKFNIPNLILSDLSKNSMIHTFETFQLNQKRMRTPEENIDYRLGDAVKTLSDLDGGIGFAAPYLIPEVCVVFPGIYQYVLGKISANQGMDIYIGHSNLSSHLVNQGAEANDIRVEQIAQSSPLPLLPEYANANNPMQMLQKRLGKLLPSKISTLENLGLESYNDQPYHRIIVSKYSPK